MEDCAGSGGFGAIPTFTDEDRKQVLLARAVSWGSYDKVVVACKNTKACWSPVSLVARLCAPFPAFPLLILRVLPPSRVVDQGFPAQDNTRLLGLSYTR